MNIFDIRETSEIVKLDVSTQEKIRLLFRVGLSRSEIAKTLKIRYQIVFKATNPKFAPKRWENVLNVRLTQERSKSKVEVEEVKLI